MKRIEYLDGIRGIASLMVVVFHFYWESLYGINEGVRGIPQALIMNGFQSIVLFFILSGDSLSIPFLRKGDGRSLASSFLKRYFRLTFLIVICSLTVYLLMHFNFKWNAQAGEVLKSEWLSSFINFKESIVSLTKFSLSDVYIGSNNYVYNPFLWTMKYELLGSLFVLLFLFSLPYMKNPSFFIFIFMTVFFVAGSHFFFFFVGIQLSLWRKSGLFDRISSKFNDAFIISIVLIIMIINSVIFYLSQKNTMILSAMFITCPVLMVAIYSSKTLKGILSNGFFVFLGKISYPLYIFHFVILVTLFSYLASKNYGNTNLMLAISLLSILASIAIAYIVEIIESKFLKHLNRVIVSNIS